VDLWDNKKLFGFSQQAVDKSIENCIDAKDCLKKVTTGSKLGKADWGRF